MRTGTCTHACMYVRACMRAGAGSVMHEHATCACVHVFGACAGVFARAHVLIRMAMAAGGLGGCMGEAGSWVKALAAESAWVQALGWRVKTIH